MESQSITFILKKLVGMTLMPVPLSLLLILLGLWWFSRAPVKSRLAFFSAFLLLAVSAFNPVADRLIAPHESYYPVFDIEQPVDAVVVLGSASHIAPPDSPAFMSLGSSAMYRLSEGLRILRANPDAILIVTGYAGFSAAQPHAEILQQAAIDRGVDPLRIFAFPTARDTENEASLTEPLLRDKRFALVTEAAHLKRATVFFEREGLNPLPAPAMFVGAHHSDWRLDSSGLYKTERAFYETMGRAWQWLKSFL